MLVQRAGHGRTATATLQTFMNRTDYRKSSCRGRNDWVIMPTSYHNSIEIFADVAGTDELSLYRDLVSSDRDVIRVRGDEGGDGAASANERIKLAGSARGMVLAAACSLHDPRSVYSAAAGKEAMNFVRKLRMGQSEQESFVVTLLTPVVSPPIQQSFIQDSEHNEDPIERKMTRRLVSALRAARNATEQTMGGNVDAFLQAVDDGVSANLCEALVKIDRSILRSTGRQFDLGPHPIR